MYDFDQPYLIGEVAATDGRRIDEIVERRIVGEESVPIRIAVDFNGGEQGWNRGAPCATS